MHAQVTNHAAIGRGNNVEESAAVSRIRAEFAEMPGLKLTLPQASRLFQLEALRCQRVLRFLVETGQLVERGNTFLRTTSA